MRGHIAKKGKRYYVVRYSQVAGVQHHSGIVRTIVAGPERESPLLLPRLVPPAADQQQEFVGLECLR